MEFLRLPLDVRLILYELVLADHQTVAYSRQPNNAHLALPHTCRLVYYETAHCFHTYVSLRNEFQMERFYQYIASFPEAACSVRWADVAYDGQSPHVCTLLLPCLRIFIQSSLGHTGIPAPSHARKTDFPRDVARLRCSPLSPLYRERYAHSHRSIDPLTVLSSSATAVPSRLRTHHVPHQCSQR